MTARGDFERFVLAVSRPADRSELPPPGGPPTPEQSEAFAATAHANGIDLLGSPLES